MKNLSNLKADCLLARRLSEFYPNNKMYDREYELAQREVSAREREAFCDIKEPK